mmetsp:Transcript_5237/g.7356  ORF Transcript_5237/g.7356 Transcript_5237/m.7356 type:complete len:94 (-) Transcript_5237:46-327(-)
MESGLGPDSPHCEDARQEELSHSPPGALGMSPSSSLSSLMACFSPSIQRDVMSSHPHELFMESGLGPANGRCVRTVLLVCVSCVFVCLCSFAA